MSTPFPPSYPSGGPDYSDIPNYVTAASAQAGAQARPYSPWRSAVLAWAGGLGLRMVFGFVIGIVAVFSGLAAGVAHGEVGLGRLLSAFVLVSLAISVVVALLQGSFLARRGAFRPYTAPLTAAAAVVAAGAAARPLGLGVPVLIGAVVEISVIALLTAPRAARASRP